MKILLLFAQSASVLGKQRNSSYNVSAMHFMIDDDDGLLLDSVPYKLALYVLKNDLFENQVESLTIYSNTYFKFFIKPSIIAS